MKRRFKDIKIGEEFRFASERDFPISGMEMGPWIKVSARQYIKDRGTPWYMRCKVGSVNAEVL